MELRNEVVPDDVDRVRAIVSSSGFFSAEEQDIAVELVEETLERGAQSGYSFVFGSLEGATVAYACFGRIPCTESSYDLYWIATEEECRGRGFGRVLLEESEARVRAAGGTLLYVETSTREQYGPTRRFYERAGYDEAARLPDFYRPGDGKVVYCKRLGPDGA